jgi:hypothetical protein
MPIQNKTKENKNSVSQFINSIKDKTQKAESKLLQKIFSEATGKRAKMWGDSIIGYNKYKYKRRDGSEHEFLVTGFSPRKGKISLYIMPGFDNYKKLLDKLGPHKTSVGCLYIKSLEDIHLPTLKTLIKRGYKDMKKRGDFSY